MPVVVRCALGCVLWLVALCTQAQPFEGLYRVHEPVSSQQPAERDKGLVRAFDALVVRLTAKIDAPNAPALASARANPQQWITRYGYENAGLLVDFDPATVQAALRQAGLTLWGAERPSILIWWLNDSDQGSQLVGDGQEGAGLLRQAAQYRGMPLLLPLADLGEQLAVTAEALKQETPDALQGVSGRYSAEGLLGVYVSNHPEGGLQADWRLWIEGRKIAGKAQAANKQALADAVVLAAQGALAPLFAGKAPVIPTESIVLEIQGNTLERFSALDRLLSGMGRLVAVEDTRLVYRVEAVRDSLKAQLARAQLQELPADPSAPAGNATLRYRW